MCVYVLQVLQTAAAAVKVCCKRDALDDGLPLLAPMEGNVLMFSLYSGTAVLNDMDLPHEQKAVLGVH